jgi:hypothetical protein
MLDSQLTSKKRNNLEKIKNILVDFEKNKYLSDIFIKAEEYDELNKIKVKLSYPHEKYINIKIK